MNKRPAATTASMRPMLLQLLFLFISSCCFRKCSGQASTNVPMLFVFGDSFVDAGNNNFLNTTAHANHFPYGINFDTRRATGRWSDGRIIPDYLANNLQIYYPSCFLDRYGNISNGANFASAGSGILNTTHIGGEVLTFTDQVFLFEQHRQLMDDHFGKKVAAFLTSKSIFYINVGNNDVNDFIQDNDATNITPAYRNFLLLQMQHKIQRLYELGARKIIVTSAYALGCAPMYQIQGRCNPRGQNAAKYYNEGLFALTRTLQGTLAGLSVVYANTYQVMLEIHQRPTFYGLRNVTHACCPTVRRPSDPWCYETDNFCERPATFLFWDTAHPTDTFNRVAAARFWSGSRRYIFPVNVRTLAAI